MFFFKTVSVSELHHLCSKLVLQSWCEVVITTSQKTCFSNGLVDYALLLCRKFAAKLLPHQVCHDKLISRKIKLAASAHAVWVSINRGLLSSFNQIGQIESIVGFGRNSKAVIEKSFTHRKVSKVHIDDFITLFVCSIHHWYL
ncbi:hypothetical protein AVEN_98436-1 [Araneus ventricosus]|uniref:Uncharacterized protein n=1 Tax=Araneus ventricosus TaxID=182803 RepID=A0A4Y2N7B2_ARAVE|nr:hypothetical protein AVEN_98436-1 [Araneus ventricosus]